MVRSPTTLSATPLRMPALALCTALIDLCTDVQLLANLINGSPRLGRPAYNWWSECPQTLANSPRVNFVFSGNFSYATSFPQLILVGAAFDDTPIQAVASVVSTEGRAFSNAGRGLDYWTPGIVV
ncbi:hypothetical protein LXA43DRAFT_1019779 [Ganoderma leucocontextum]|nr:hypothetical protein LXA43DRAFT_1019779 [Ganoderma leucocontextum]